jgi:dTDP-4-dehydrorhamnose reductase
MEKLLLIGSSGLLGSSLLEDLSPLYKVFTVTRTSKESDFQCDMSDKCASQNLLSDILPDIIINLAALTDVDGCEKDLSFAYQVNTKIAENISYYANANANAIFIIHISTDHFYNKNNSKECDVEILNNYAMTKYCAEKVFSSDNSVILRTNFFGKSKSHNSLGLCDSIYNRVKEKLPLKLFNDVFFSPLSIPSLCDVIVLCLSKKIPGLYNAGSKKGMSKKEFLIKFLDNVGFSDIDFKSISIDDLNLATPRPKDMRMDVSHFETVYQYSLPLLEDEIKRVSNEFK